MRITIVDYGMGNLKSIYSVLSFLGVKNIVVSSNFKDLNNADKIILPGVGSFRKAMHIIKSKRIDYSLDEIILIKKKPILGICLGMQLLSKSSTEDGFTKGLGYIDAKCTRLNDENLKVPHVGFNQIKINEISKIYNGISKEPDFYFTHSYKLESEADISQSYCFYGSDFIASFERENIIGVQFHPELSQINGIRLLQNFINII